MSRLAYIWVFVTIAFAFWFHSYEEGQRNEAIMSATRDALYVGIKAGCEENNDIRDQVWVTAEALHPTVAEDIRDKLAHQACEKEARDVVRLYITRAKP